MRLDKPIGILLLWFPTAWALWMANQGSPPMMVLVYFFLGTIVMRSAGCVVNDLADRHIDKHVQRTRSRPITTGEIGIRDAIILFVTLLCVALYIVVQLPIQCFYYALLGLFVTIVYPFCKRWIQAPQLILSLAFSVAIPMVYVASSVAFNRDMLLLVLINLLWVVVYDTIYAMVDREDDLKLGVQSTAVLFGRYDRVIIGLLMIIMHGLWFFIAHDGFFLVGWVIGASVLIRQQYLIALRNPANCFKAFQWSVGYGLIMSSGMVAFSFSNLTVFFSNGTWFNNIAATMMRTSSQ